VRRTVRVPSPETSEPRPCPGHLPHRWRDPARRGGRRRV